MISMALYGAMLATTSGGAMVVHRAGQGWSRQLRLTPLRPLAYIAVKVIVAHGARRVSVLVGLRRRRGSPAAHMPDAVGRRGLVAWVGSLVFAAFGLFMGYLLPSENVMQILGPVLALLAFAGGLFVPLTDLGPPLRRSPSSRRCTALNELVHAPLTGDAFAARPSSTSWSGWPCSSAARPGGSAGTRRGSEQPAARSTADRRRELPWRGRAPRRRPLRRRRGAGRGRCGWSSPLIWLVYLSSPFEGAIDMRPTGAVRMVGVAALLAFAVVYVLPSGCWPAAPRRRAASATARLRRRARRLVSPRRPDTPCRSATRPGQLGLRRRPA